MWLQFVALSLSLSLPFCIHMCIYIYIYTHICHNVVDLLVLVGTAGVGSVGCPGARAARTAGGGSEPRALRAAASLDEVVHVGVTTSSGLSLKRLRHLCACTWTDGLMGRSDRQLGHVPHGSYAVYNLERGAHPVYVLYYISIIMGSVYGMVCKHN